MVESLRIKVLFRYMKRIVNLILNLFSFAYSARMVKNSKFVLIEDVIFGHGVFGHATLESIKTEEYSEKIFVISSRMKANSTYADLIIKRAKSRGFRENRIVNRAFHGNLFLSKRFQFPSLFSFISTPNNFTHDELSNLGPIAPLTSILDLPITFQSVPYITLMNRSNKYQKINESNLVHNHRNFDFLKISNAINEVNDSEFTFVRIGQISSEETSNPKIYDVREDVTNNKYLDIAIQEHSSSYFGADSGPVWIPMSQHKPVGLVDVIPLGNPFPTDPRKVLCITKQIYSKKDKRLLSIPELASQFILSLTSLTEYLKNGLEVVDNSQDEIINFFEFWLNHIVRADDEAILEINRYMEQIRSKNNLSKLPAIYFPEKLKT